MLSGCGLPFFLLSCFLDVVLAVVVLIIFDEFWVIDFLQIS